jgi:predicted RNA-binding Zn-ribbon protein involved in translation (DUF1610 family)
MYTHEEMMQALKRAADELVARSYEIVTNPMHPGDPAAEALAGEQGQGLRSTAAVLRDLAAELQDRRTSDALVQVCLGLVEARQRGSNVYSLDQALDELEQTLQGLGLLRRCVSCGEIIPADEHSHECPACGATLCNYCAIAGARCPGCTLDAPCPD